MSLTPEQLDYHRQWRAANPGKVREAVKTWQVRNKSRLAENARKWRANWTPEQKENYRRTRRRAALKRRYGVTPEEYEALLLKQNGTCALCERTPEQERYGTLNVDHCHSSGKVRGLLCTPCNHALGVLGDTPEGLSRALRYVGGVHD